MTFDIRGPTVEVQCAIAPTFGAAARAFQARYGEPAWVICPRVGLGVLSETQAWRDALAGRTPQNWGTSV